jgi:hypothetical protein
MKSRKRKLRAPTMEEEILAIVSGERHESPVVWHGEEAVKLFWDGMEAVSDLEEFYHSLEDPIQRVGFEQVIIESLCGDGAVNPQMAIILCGRLKFHTVVPKLLEIIRDEPDHRLIISVCHALEQLEVEEAADFFKATGRVTSLFKVDFPRSIPLIQQFIEEEAIDGYVPGSVLEKIPCPVLLDSMFQDLYMRFGKAGIFLLLNELHITTQAQKDLVFDTVQGGLSRIMYTGPGHKQITEEERDAVREEVERYLEVKLEDI